MAEGGAQGRVLVIGLDGGTFALLRPWLEEGTLPHLSRLYREGVRGVLHSVVPPLSPEAWSTFMTGKHPGHHGVMNFLSFQPGSYELHFNSGADVREPTLWKLASEAGRKVGVVAVPMTYPPEEVNGYLISGLETPGVKSQFTYPAELSEELRRNLGGYDLHGDFLVRCTPETYLANVRETVHQQLRAVNYLFENRPADLSVVVIGATDRIQHYFWKYLDRSHPRHEANPKYGDGAMRAYARVDAAVGEMMDRVPDPKTVIIMSDHGFGPSCKLVHLNRWLEANGYLHRRAGAGGAFSAARGTWLGARRYLPRGIKDWLKSKLPALRRQVESFLLLSRIDWEHTRAFSLSTQFGYIYLNRKDRFPQGAIDPGSGAAALCDALMKELATLRDPATGEPVVDSVHRTCDLYPGPACAQLPDLVVLWREGYIARTDIKEQAGGGQGRIVETDLAGGDLDRILSVEQSGLHRPEGILIAHGAGIAEPAEIAGAQLIDLPPTILHLLGEPVPGDMQGRVLEELLDPAFLATRPIRYTDAGGVPAVPPAAGRASPYTAEEAKQIEQHLRDLGYLE